MISRIYFTSALAVSSLLIYILFNISEADFLEDMGTAVLCGAGAAILLGSIDLNSIHHSDT